MGVLPHLNGLEYNLGGMACPNQLLACLMNLELFQTFIIFGKTKTYCKECNLVRTNREFSIPCLMAQVQECDSIDQSLNQDYFNPVETETSENEHWRHIAEFNCPSTLQMTENTITYFPDNLVVRISNNYRDVKLSSIVPLQHSSHLKLGANIIYDLIATIWKEGEQDTGHFIACVRTVDGSVIFSQICY